MPPALYFRFRNIIIKVFWSSFECTCVLMSYRVKLCKGRESKDQ